MRLTLFSATFLCALAFAGSALGAGNPFGVTVVRFAPGTSPAQMRAAVTSAGGVVVTDLSEIDALGVVPRSKSFAPRLAGSKAVTDLFQDSVLPPSAAPTSSVAPAAARTAVPAMGATASSPIPGTTWAPSSASRTPKGSSSGTTGG